MNMKGKVVLIRPMKQDKEGAYIIENTLAKGMEKDRL